MKRINYCTRIILLSSITAKLSTSSANPKRGRAPFEPPWFKIKITRRIRGILLSSAPEMFLISSPLPRDKPKRGILQINGGVPFRKRRLAGSPKLMD
jgi:hypothetical protein